jgi:hypothetical protein
MACHDGSPPCDYCCVNVGRVVLVVTSGVVAGLATWLAAASWDQASRVATVASALAAVAAVGVAVWAAVRGPAAGSGSVKVSDTGTAVAGRQGLANTGARMRRWAGVGRVRAQHTGDAVASDGGDTNTGVRLD